MTTRTAIRLGIARKRTNMSAHENLARLKTAARLSGCIGPSASSRARAKQRKWRVLVSIGLLLPALAAIIGEY